MLIWAHSKIISQYPQIPKCPSPQAQEPQILKSPKISKCRSSCKVDEVSRKALKSTTPGRAPGECPVQVFVQEFWSPWPMVFHSVPGTNIMSPLPRLATKCRRPVLFLLWGPTFVHLGAWPSWCHLGPILEPPWSHLL